jgi:hypothetical protein
MSLLTLCFSMYSPMSMRTCMQQWPTDKYILSWLVTAKLWTCVTLTNTSAVTLPQGSDYKCTADHWHTHSCRKESLVFSSHWTMFSWLHTERLQV